MENLNAYDWITIVSFFVAVASLMFNAFQWKRQRTIEKDVSLRTSAGMNAGYQALWRIAVVCNHIRASKEQLGDKGELLKEVLSRVQEITGNADTGRATMNSISRDLFGVRLFYESAVDAQKKVNNIHDNGS